MTSTKAGKNTSTTTWSLYHPRKSNHFLWAKR